MKVGDLVVHIGATPNGYRTKLVCAIEINHQHYVDSRETIVFADGRIDWKDCWKVFKGWNNDE